MPTPSAKKLVLVIDNVRSAYNVGSIFRSADAFGVSKIICVGITPYPIIKTDRRLPHIADRAHRMISKTALGAENTVPCAWVNSLDRLLDKFQQRNFKLYTLERTADASDIRGFTASFPCLLVVGNELSGVNQAWLKRADAVLQIPMVGRKESLNVAVAAGIALFKLLI